MANRTGVDKVRSCGFGLVAVPCSITIGSSGAISSQSTEFGAVTAAIVDCTAGQYTFTFDEKYRSFVGLSAVSDYQGTVVDGTWAIETGYSNSTGTITLVHVTAGSDDDPADTTVHHFIFWMKNTDL